MPACEGFYCKTNDYETRLETGNYDLSAAGGDDFVRK